MSNMHRSARSLNQSAYSVGTAASTGRIVRQNPAPKFHPFIIIAVVITIGMVIVGLVMTIIANWPGYSAIGFNVLEIVGPVILGVGGLALILTVAVVVMRNKSSRDQWQQKMIDGERTRAMWASRTTMEPTTPTSSIGRPNKSILKKTPSTSTYGRDSNVFEEGSDSGVPRTNNISYEPESDGSESGRRQHPVYKIETMPDPHAARPGMQQPYYPPNSAQYQPNNAAPYQPNHSDQYQPNSMNYPPVPTGRLNSSTESESLVPVPIRVPKAKKRTTNNNNPQYEAESYATQEPPLARGSPLVGTPDLGYMGNRLSYTSDGAEPMVESPPPMAPAQAPKVRRQLQSYENTGYDAFADPSSAQYQPPAPEHQKPPKPKKKKQPQSAPVAAAEGAPEDLDRGTEVRRSRRKKKKQRGTDAAAATQPDPQLTRINISAQPGTSVQITPGTYSAQPNPSQQVPPGLRGSKGSVGSVETEI